MGDAEVDEHGVAVDEQDVARLEVAVDDADLVQRSQRLGQTPPEAQQLLGREGAVLLDMGVERGPGDVAGDDVGLVAVEVGVEDRGHPGRAHPREGRDLAGEPGPGVLVVGDVGTQHLHRDGATALVEGEVDDAHPPFAELLDHPVGADPREVVDDEVLGGAVLAVRLLGRGISRNELGRHAVQGRGTALGALAAPAVRRLSVSGRAASYWRM